MATARQQQILNQRAKFKAYASFSDKRRVTPAGSLASAASSIARKSAQTELESKQQKYDQGLIGNDEMLSFLQKFVDNTSLTASEKLDVQKKISDFQDAITVGKLSATYEGTTRGTAAGIQAAKSLQSYYLSKASSMLNDTPAQSEAMQQANKWGQEVQSQTEAAQKSDRALKRAQLFRDVAKEVPGSEEEANQKAQAYQELADQARIDGDETEAMRYETNAQNALNQIPAIQERQTKQAQSATRKEINDYINTTWNDYVDGKITAGQAYANFNFADEKSAEIGDTSLQLRLNNLVQQAATDVNKGITYFSDGSSFGTKYTPGKDEGGELIINSDGSISNAGTPGKLIGSASFNGVPQPISNVQADALIQKYFPKDQWATAKAVMMAESGGNALAIGDNYPIDTGNGPETIPSYGLFQIRGLQGRPDPNTLLNPEENVKYAAKMWKEQGWSQPWTTYREGTYKQFLGQPVTADTQPAPSQPVTGKAVAGAATQKGPSTATSMSDDYEKQIKQIHSWFLNGKGPDGKPFNVQMYFATLGNVMQSHSEDLQTIIDGISNTDPYQKIKYKGTSTTVGKLQEKLQKELDSVTTEANQIQNGDLVPVIKKSGNKYIIDLESTSANQEFNKNYMPDASGIYHKVTYEKKYFNTYKDALVYASSDPNNEMQVMYDKGKPYVYTGGRYVDMYDTKGNRIRYEEDSKYGFLPVPEGPKKADIQRYRDSIIKSVDSGLNKGEDVSKLMKQPINPMGFESWLSANPVVKPKAVTKQPVLQNTQQVINANKQNNPINLPNVISPVTNTIKAIPPVVGNAIKTEAPIVVNALTQAPKTIPAVVGKQVNAVTSAASQAVSNAASSVAKSFQPQGTGPVAPTQSATPSGFSGQKDTWSIPPTAVTQKPAATQTPIKVNVTPVQPKPSLAQQIYSTVKNAGKSVLNFLGFK